MKILAAEQFSLLDKRAKLHYLFDLAAEVEANWSQVTLRRRFLDTFANALESIRQSEDSDLKNLVRLIPLALRDIEQKQYLALIVPLKRLLEETDASMQSHVVKGDKNIPAGEDFPLTVILDNIRSAHNVGSIFRSCEAAGARELILCGYTATPANAKLRKTAMGSDDSLPWSEVMDIAEAIARCKSNGAKVYALETTAAATEIFSFTAQFPLAIVAGNEHFGLSQEVLNQCDGVISIPMFGRKNSLNVANALSVLGFELRRQFSLLS